MARPPDKPAEDRFFVRQGDHVDGPHPVSRIRDWHREGRLPDDILLSRDGQHWHPVRWHPGRWPRSPDPYQA